MAKTKVKQVAELAKGDGRPKSSESKWTEIGTPGLEIMSGFVSEAYHADLQWPACQPLFSRIRRSDPEISIIRQLFVALASDIGVMFQTPEQVESPTDDDKKAVDFGNEILEDLDGGIAGWIDTLISYVPFMGWGWWEVVPGLRRKDWRPPGGDPWRSRFEDGRIGLRRLAWRDHSSFDKWEIDEYTGQLHGMWQRDHPNEPVLIPLDRSVHLTFGDMVNPEGLSPLEAIWRLERIKYGLEVIQGIGFEHSAGHVKFQSDQNLTSADKTNIKKAARALLTAQEGNYMLLPGHIQAEVVDVDFGASRSILEAIKYYGILKLQLYSMQWVALSATSGVGSYAAKKEDTTMFVLYFNAMMKGFLDQLDRQIGKWIFDINKEAFPNMTMRPKLVPTPIEKIIDLGDLTQFVEMLLLTGFPIDNQDLIAIRRKSDFLPEALPVEEDEIEPIVPVTTAGSAKRSVGDDGEEVVRGKKAETEAVKQVALNGAQVTAAMAIVVQVINGEIPYDTGLNSLQILFGLDKAQALLILGTEGDVKRLQVKEPKDDDDEGELDDAEMVTADEVRGVIGRFSTWAEKNAPRVFKLLQKKVKEK